MSVMISLRDLRLTNTSGHCVLVKANTPAMIPRPLRGDAITAGMVETDQPIPPGEIGHVPEGAAPAPVPTTADVPVVAPTTTVPAPPVAAPVPTTPDPVVEAPDTIVDTGKDDAEALSTAIRKLLVRNDPTDFKNDGTPKVVKVVSEMPPECARPTATQVFAEYEKLQDDPDLAITD